jgi:predicted pyridoxine 5'-phosphate oxidase superfamily flavin-nucleotide-binding protein
MAAGPFHAGERTLQDASGVLERMQALGTRIIRDRMPEPHRELFAKLPTLFAGALDADGQPWATVLHGSPGFMQTPDDRTLRIGAYPRAEDPASAGLRVGAAVGLLGIEPHTRRRNRANGVVTATEAEAWSVHVQQSFGNCPKYIHGRKPVPRPERVPEPVRAEGPLLSERARRLVEQSDTLFIASSSAGRLAADELAVGSSAGVDVSHRGGRAGFVSVQRGRGGTSDQLALEDYPGNSMYCTLGNLLLWPRAGLLFVDWEHGDLLQLAVSATVVRGEASRLLRLDVRSGFLRPAALPLSWSAPEAPPQFRGPDRDESSG